MPLFKSRTIQEILNDAINYVHYNTQLTDFNVGSVIRTLLEAMAIEDSEQYAQMENILTSFFLDGTSGALLDDRAAQFDLARKGAQPSTGTIRFIDTELRRTFLMQDLDGGESVISVQDVSVFPPTNFTVRLGEGTGNGETVSIASSDTASNTLTLAAGTAVGNGHIAASIAVDEIDNLGSMVCLVTGEADRIIPAGIVLRSKPTNTIAAVEAITKAVGLLTNGNFASGSVSVVTTTLGSKSALSVKSLNSIVGSPPFNGAEVINLSLISGGSNLESDAEFRQRIKDHISGLGKGTVVSLTSALLQVKNTTTAESVQRAKIIEDFEHVDFDEDPPEDFQDATVLAYINDGSSSFFGDQLPYASDTLIKKADAGADTLLMFDAAGFPTATKASRKFIIIGTGTNTPVASSYSDVNSTASSLSGLDPVLPSNFGVDAPVINVELLSDTTLKNRKYYTLDRSPITEDALLIYRTAGIPLNETFPTLGTATLLVENTDYLLNKAIGQIEFLAGKIPDEGSALLAFYTVYTGLIKTAQKTMDGDLDNFSDFPGFRSAGVKVLVRPAVNLEVDISMDLSIDLELTNFETAAFLVGQFVTSYINNLDIGESVILAEMIERAMGVTGITNAKILNVDDDIPVNNNQVPVTGTLSFV